VQRGDIFLTDIDGRTALFYAAERGNEEIVWILLSSLAGTGISCQRGTLLEVRDHDGVLAEDWAQINGLEKIKRILSIERQRIAYFE
jgi:ankyrin repeat protein